MIRNDKVYTFLLTRNGAEKISIRRIEIPKSQFHAGLLGIIFFTGLVSLGIAGSMSREVVAKSNAPVTMPAPAQIVSASTAAPAVPIQTGTAYLENSGGPSFINEQEDAADDVAIEGVEARIRQLELLADASYLPTSWAHKGKINNEFGFRRNPFGGRSYEFHAGMDIDGERGDMVHAPANGVVIKAGWSGGYGNMVEIDHGYGLTTRYGHLSKIEVNVGSSITRGQMIGLVGSTGRSTGPHLHYELRLNEKSINPRFLLSSKSAIAND